MKITVIGCGRWGSLIAWYLDKINKGLEITLCGRPSSAHMKEFLRTRSNGLLTLPQKVKLSTDYSSVKDADIVIISIASQGLNSLMRELSEYMPKNKIFVLCMKGIEVESGRRLSQIAEESLDPSNKVAVWLGPGHVQEFYAGIPNCMVIDGKTSKPRNYL